MKAIVPVAGLGTRMLPATKAIPKEMLAVVDKPTEQDDPTTSDDDQAEDEAAAKKSASKSVKKPAKKTAKTKEVKS